MAPALDGEEDRVREELRHRCLLGDRYCVCELLDEVPLSQVQGALDDEGSTALHLAVRCGYLELTQELIQRQFQVNCPDADAFVDGDGAAAVPGRRTPLHIACMEDNPDVVRALLDGNADANIVDQNGQTALHKAVLGNSFEILKLIVEEGKDVQTTALDVDGNTPFHIAAEFGKVQFVECLLAKDPSAIQACSKSNKHGWTALHLCAHGREMRRKPSTLGKFSTCVKLFLEAKADVDAHDDWSGKTPLHRAAQTGDRETVEMLLRYNAAVAAEDFCRWTPLHYAAQDGHLTVCTALLQAKAVVERPNPSCLTPLAIATIENQVKIAELLMSYGADQNLRGKGLASPIMVARKEPNKYVDMLALFELGFIHHEP